jgi:hypothetical protein
MNLAGLPTGLLQSVENRTINNMITNGGPDRAQRRLAIIVKVL